ncbi:hypothetical protein PUNSTDRAFT_65075 [Punctularia strigosozonata HHB-11173 SS5]|uniref:uncharacterized protein n=1 Tax=Punctularia strigosozonata (strain HHB-11173) TaxID=741275 RepID=UPI000441653B|nr:uncharacterized protein PUNSTDRAFT_65075 [Punctularia strigosozonata HHB-11173 SS5]EIN10646.1 hypothetical protein PUNSTDRAFT_65075 [Punctularia strigosozonata HHB-11173 SS5]
MDQKLAQVAALYQKDKGAAYQALVNDVFATTSQPTFSRDLHALVESVVNQDSVVVGRQVLSEIVKKFKDISDSDLRKKVVQITLDVVQPRLVSYEEQASLIASVNALRYQLAEILESEEEWSEAARVLMGISLDSANRTGNDEEKFKLYVYIIRLLLEDEDSVQAETYYNRAALLVGSCQDKATLLSFKLCQARIMDYSRRFLEAAARYHDLSWTGEIDEDERQFMLSAAVTCAVLAPAGPNRSRLLASLCRDERTSELPTHNILSKMFLDHILRPAEVKEFEKTLKPHQLAKISLSVNERLAAAVEADDDNDDDKEPNVSTRRGPSTVLDRAVLEHNLLASSKIYKNITFRGLGALLDLTPGAAETMARKMIEQGRLKASIDQVDKLIWFESEREEDNAQGKAGGLGDVEQEEEDTGAPFTKQWDMQIRMTAANVESIVQHLTEKRAARLAAASQA